MSIYFCPDGARIYKMSGSIWGQKLIMITQYFWYNASPCEAHETTEIESGCSWSSSRRPRLLHKGCVPTACECWSLMAPREHARWEAMVREGLQAEWLHSHPFLIMTFFSCFKPQWLALHKSGLLQKRFMQMQNYYFLTGINGLC